MPDGITEVERGMYVSDEWKDAYGLTISVVGTGLNAYTPVKPGTSLKQARIFDTTNPGTNNDNGDPDLGSPNWKCPDGGPGIGCDGQPGADGENCEAVGNVLIIQEGDKTASDDNYDGGNFTFTFEKSTNFESIGLMDIARVPHMIEVHLENGFVYTVPYVGLGDNSVQKVMISATSVVKVVVIMPGCGAITFLDFCISFCGPGPLPFQPRATQVPLPYDCSYDNTNQQCLYDSSTIDDPYSSFGTESGEYAPGSSCNDPLNWNIEFTGRYYHPLTDTTTFAYTVSNLKTMMDPARTFYTLQWDGLALVASLALRTLEHPAALLPQVWTLAIPPLASSASSLTLRGNPV